MFLPCVLSSIGAAFALSSVSPPPIVPEIGSSHLSRVSALVSSALGDDASSSRDRYASARSSISGFRSSPSASAPPPNELVYGELSVPVLATVFDAVGVSENDVFLDIGSGDGALVLAASLLYAPDEERESNRTKRNAIRKAIGIEIVPGLVERSVKHRENLSRILEESSSLARNQAEVELALGDVHDPSDNLRDLLEQTTIAICFATTWSAGNSKGGDRTSLGRRMLPRLSSALSDILKEGCRVVVIDGRLDCQDGFSWEGDLRVECPDTAPYSTAALYTRRCAARVL